MFFVFETQKGLRMLINVQEIQEKFPDSSIAKRIKQYAAKRKTSLSTGPYFTYEEVASFQCAAAAKDENDLVSFIDTIKEKLMDMDKHSISPAPLLLFSSFPTAPSGFNGHLYPKPLKSCLKAAFSTALAGCVRFQAIPLILPAPPTFLSPGGVYWRI